MTRLVTAEVFAKSIDRKVRSIYDALYRGGDVPPPVRIGGRLYFAQDDIDEWIDGKRRDAQSEMDERQQAIARSLVRARPSNSNRITHSRGPRAGKQSGPSLNTPQSEVVSHEE